MVPGSFFRAHPLDDQRSRGTITRDAVSAAAIMLAALHPPSSTQRSLHLPGSTPARRFSQSRLRLPHTQSVRRSPSGPAYLRCFGYGSTRIRQTSVRICVPSAQSRSHRQNPVSHNPYWRQRRSMRTRLAQLFGNSRSGFITARFGSASQFDLACSGSVFRAPRKLAGRGCR